MENSKSNVCKVIDIIYNISRMFISSYKTSNNDSFYDMENVRTEYTALTSYSNQVVSFRFLLVSFYITAIGLLFGSGITMDKCILILILSICLWSLELRNRGLLANLSERGVQIEREIWGYNGIRAFDGFICHQNKPETKNDLNAPEKPRKDNTKLLFWSVRLPVSHTLALDTLYISVIIFTLFQLYSITKTAKYMPPFPPGSINYIQNNSQSVIFWKPSLEEKSNGEVYIIYRFEHLKNSFQKLAEVPSNENSFKDSTASIGKKYGYYLVTQNRQGLTSSPSEIIYIDYTK